MIGTASWDKVSHLVITEVFRYLGNNDRFNASLVCKDWSDAVYTPQIWRRMKLKITGEDEVKDEKKVKLAEKVGEWVRDVEISFRTHTKRPTDDDTTLVAPTERTVDDTSRILYSLHKAKLTKFELSDLAAYRWDESDLPLSSRKLYESLNKFIETQSSLEWFNMTDCSISMATGLKILENVSLLNSNTLQEFFIRDFFDTDSVGDNGLHSEPAFRSLMTRFTQLTSVEMCYHCLDEEILLGLARNCAENFQILRVQCKDNEPCLHTISSPTWREVRRFCPNLWVDMEFEFFNYIPDITRLLPLGMPLNIVVYDSDIEDDDCNDLFYQLYYFTDILVNLTIWIKSESIPEELVNFLKACRNLKSLEYEGKLLEQHVVAICEAQKEGKLKLNNCDLKVNSREDDIEDSMARIGTEYGPIFAAQNAQFNIVRNTIK